MPLHPAIRIAVLVALAVTLPRADLPRLLSLLALLLLVHVQAAAGAAALRGLWRLRWLLLGLLFLYAWMDPGPPLWDALPGLPASAATLAAQRGLVLCDLLLAAQWLLRTPAPELAAALAWLCRPLNAAGVDVERASLRLVLALDRAQVLAAGWRSADGRSWLDRVADTIRRIERDPAPTLPPAPRLPSPPAWQWLAPVAVLLLCLPWPS
ncbi:MAG TPA: hypothetical protein VM369_06985 [Candidatus Binatia bacterium]|nr:hypothetical protein [Candidatus Binatia bacterium]